jgi:hypothetical protein
VWPAIDGDDSNDEPARESFLDRARRSVMRDRLDRADHRRRESYYRARRKSSYTLKNVRDSLIRGRRTLDIGSYESLGYDTYNRASQILVRTLERGYTLTYFLCLEIGCAHLKILQS